MPSLAKAEQKDVDHATLSRSCSSGFAVIARWLFLIKRPSATADVMRKSLFRRTTCETNKGLP